MECKRCKQTEVRKAGQVRGLQRYVCRSCGYYFTLTPLRGKSQQEKLLALHLYASGLSLRKIGKFIGVSQVAVQKWVQILVPQLCPKLEPEGQVIIMELDEMWHYIKKKKTSSGSGKRFAVIQVDLSTGNAVTAAIIP